MPKVHLYSRVVHVAFISVSIFLSLVESTQRPWLEGTRTALPLLKKQKVSPDTSLYTFGLTSKHLQNEQIEGGLQDEQLTLGIPICSCILVTSIPASAQEEGISRPYTPVSSKKQQGSFDLLVKSYPNGLMSKEFEKLRTGDCMEFRQIPFNIKEHYPFGKPDAIIMLAAGTGITPMYQALLRIFEEGNHIEVTKLKTKIHLFYGCKTVKDILLYKELEEMRRKNPDQLMIHYALSEGVNFYGRKKFQSGRITKEQLMKNCPEIIPSCGAGSEKRIDCRVWVCGSPSFYDSFSGDRGDKHLPSDSILSELGFRKEQVMKF